MQSRTHHTHISSKLLLSLKRIFGLGESHQQEQSVMRLIQRVSVMLFRSSVMPFGRRVGYALGMGAVTCAVKRMSDTDGSSDVLRARVDRVQAVSSPAMPLREYHLCVCKDGIVIGIQICAPRPAVHCMVGACRLVADGMATPLFTSAFLRKQSAMLLVRRLTTHAANRRTVPADTRGGRCIVPASLPLAWWWGLRRGVRVVG